MFRRASTRPATEWITARSAEARSGVFPAGEAGRINGNRAMVDGASFS
jgi:hypothetical protein